MDNKLQETQEGYFIMKWRHFLPMIIFIVLSTNTVSIFYQKQSQNTDKIEYNDKKADRKIKQAAEKLLLENEIIDLTSKLDKCKEEKNN